MKIKSNQQGQEGSFIRLLAVVVLLCVSAILFASSFQADPGKSQPGIPSPAPSQATPAPITVSLPVDTLDPTVPPSTVFEEPVVTTNIDGALNYIGFQGDFTFDETICAFSAVSVQKAGLTAGNWNVSGHVLPGPGPIRTLRISAGSNDFIPLSGSGTLYNLRMLRRSSAPGASTPLTWRLAPDNFLFIDGDLNSVAPAQHNGLITIAGSGGTPTPTPNPTIIVTTHNDSGPGSLRQALADAQGGDIIGFDSALNGQTIFLTGGELLVDQNVTISGPGWNQLAVSGSGGFRIFHVMPGHTVLIGGLTIQGGQLQNQSGGGIRSDQATLTIRHCVISGNSIRISTQASGRGGGIYNNGGTLSLVDSRVLSNGANAGPVEVGFGAATGGGISNGGTLTITRSIISGNFGDSNGGGISNDGMLTITDSTLNGNQSGGQSQSHLTGLGGGIYNQGSLLIQNSTISANAAIGQTQSSAVGGGIFTTGSMEVLNSTINGNAAQQSGGGIFAGGISGNGVEIANTVLKAGTSGANISGSNIISHGYNLSSDNGGGILTAPGDQINTDPMLGPLQGNGGSTLTHELLPGSPAINAGDPAFTPPPDFDQRGPGFPRVFSGRIDIGSFELQSIPATPTPTATATPTATGTPPPLTVSLPIDTLDDQIPIGTVFLEPVVTTNIDTSLDLIGFQGDFTFNETVCTFSAASAAKAGLTAGNWNVSGHVLPGPGPIRTLRVSATSNDFTPLSGSGTLYTLRMVRVGGTPGASTPLTWAASPDNFFFIDEDLNSHVPVQENGLITIAGIPPTPSPAPSPTPTATATATPTATATSGGTPTPGPLAVSLPIDTFDTSVPINTVIIEPVLTTNIDASFSFCGFQGDFTFDERVVTFSAPFVENAGLTAGNNWNLVGHPMPGPGPIRTFRVSAFSVDFTPLSGSGTFFNLRMLRVSSTPGNTSPLVWAAGPNNFIFIDGDLNSITPNQNNGLITITGTGTPTPSPAPSPTPTATATATPTATAAPSATPTPGSLAVSLPIVTFDASVPVGTVFLKPVLTTNIDASLSYIGFQGDFTYDSTVVTFSSPFVQAAGLTGVGNWNVSASILPGPGPIRTFRFSAFSLDFTPLSGSGTLFDLRMLRVGGTPGTTSPLVWQPDPNNFVFIDSDLNTHVPIQNNGLIIITGAGTPTPSPAPSPTPTATATATPTATAAPSATPTPGSLAVSLPIVTFDASVPVGTVFLKPVLTTNIDASLSYIGFQGDFTYDSTVVTFLAPFAQAAGLTGVGNWNVSASILPGPGPIRTFRFSAFSLDFTPLSGSGTLFNLRMLRVGGTPGTTSPLVWQPDPNNFVFIDSDLNTHVPIQNNGLITITGAGTPTPSPAPSPTPTATATATPTATMAPSATPTPGPLTVSLPISTFDTSVPIGTVIIQPVLTTNIDASLNYVGFQGDFTYDSTVVSFSSPFVQAAGLTAGGNWHIALGLLPGPGPIKTARLSAFSHDFIPLNGSGTLFNLMMRRVSSTPGATSPLVWQPGPDYRFLFIDGDLNSITPAQNNGLITITGAGTPAPSPTPTATATATPTPTLPPVKVSLPIDTLEVPIPGLTLEPMSTTNIDGSLNYLGFRGDFTFDQNVVTFVAPYVTGAGLTGGNWNVSANILPGPGPIRTFRFSAFSLDFTPLSGSGTLFNLRMLPVSSTPGDTSPLVWAPPPNNFVFNPGDPNSPVPEQNNGLITIAGTGTPTPNPTPSIAPPTHFAVTGPKYVGPGSPFSFTVTAQDQFNNTVPDYAGTVHFTSTDSTAELPVNSTLIGGTGTFSATLHMLGERTITATDTSNASLTGTSNVIFVLPFEPVTHFAVGALGFVGQGQPLNFTVTAQDRFNHTVPDYAGTVHFTSTDSTAELPADSTLTGGAGTFPVTFHMLGEQTITATDTKNPSLTGTSNIIVVVHIDPPTPTIPQTATPTPSPATPTPTVTPSPTPTPCTGTIIWSENFDELPAGTPACWTISTTDPDTPPNDAFCSDPAGASNCVLELMGLPSLSSASAVLHFRNSFNLEFSDGTYWDGGVLEVSSPNISGGEWLDITDSHVGGTFVTGGYTGVLSLKANNPLAGRLAWSGDSGGYIDTVINLGPNLVAQTFRMRLRFGSDGTGGAPGWRVDTMTITEGVCATPTPTPTSTPTASVSPTSTPTPARPVNLSTRMLVGTGDSIGIGGFIITSSGGVPKQVLVRAIGPSLAPFGVPNALADPTLELRGPNGVLILANDNWRDNQEGAIFATGLAPTNDLESAVLATVNPGNYTALVMGKNNTSGVGLVEVYDLGPATSQLANISTRAFVGTGGDVVIGGFILGAGDSSHLLVRGPSLAALGSSGALVDPTLELRDSSGTLLAFNDNCEASPFPPGNPLDACIDITLPTGHYTAVLAGKDGGTGIGLVEIYNLN